MNPGQPSSDFLNLMLYICENPSGNLEGVRNNLNLQVINSLDLGWKPEQIILYTNFPYEKEGVGARIVDPPRRPKTARATSFFKTWCILEALKSCRDEVILWYHDTDAYQVIPFDPPRLEKSLMFCLYSTRNRLLVQGGSMFLNRSSIPVFEEVYRLLTREGYRKDEYALTDTIQKNEFLGLFDLLDFSYNLGDNNFEIRYQLAEKPVRVVHFHPDRRESFGRFALGHNPLEVVPLTQRFIDLLGVHGFGSESGNEKKTRRKGFWSGLAR